MINAPEELPTTNYQLPTATDSPNPTDSPNSYAFTSFLSAP